MFKYIANSWDILGYNLSGEKVTSPIDSAPDQRLARIARLV